jgi:hypothetical protein
MPGPEGPWLNFGNAAVAGGGEFMNSIMRQAREGNPDVVMEQVIPVIIREGQQSLGQGRMSMEHFSDLMRKVSELREQAMMARADRRMSENKENGTGNGSGPVQSWQQEGPGGPPTTGPVGPSFQQTPMGVSVSR